MEIAVDLKARLHDSLRGRERPLSASFEGLHTPVHDEQAVIGLAGHEAELRDCLTDWQHGRPMIRLIDLHPIWK
jgi:hypothetical protein